MTTYRITAQGCDDSTEVDLELTDDEVRTVRMLAAAVTAAAGDSGCKPRLKVQDHADIADVLAEEAAEREFEMGLEAEIERGRTY